MRVTSEPIFFHPKVIMQSTLKYFPSWRRVAQVLIMAGAAALASCGGGGGGGTELPGPAAPTALTVSYGVKAFSFSWAASAEATSYRLFEDIDGPAGPEGFVEVGTVNTSNIAFVPPGLLHTRLNAQYVVQACNSAGCGAHSDPVNIEVNKAIGYFKASNTGPTDRFGQALALSADGLTLAVASFQEDSNATGVGGPDNDNTADSGAVYVFTKNAGVWTQQAYLKASNTGANDNFGSALALSANGNTLSVGAKGEGSTTGNQLDNNAVLVGAVYVFTRTGGTWTQQAYLKASNMAVGNLFGFAVSLSADGMTLAVGAPGENGNTGVAYIFVRVAAAWVQQALLTASNGDPGDQFGTSLALSADGTTLAASAPVEASGFSAIEADDSSPGAGAVYIFARAGNAWPQQAYIKASNVQASDIFGAAVALSGDGNTLAVGANFERSKATGVDGDQTDNSVPFAGAVYVFSRTGATWSQQAYLKASNTGVVDMFGLALALSSDGNTLAVGAPNEASDSVGMGGDQASNAMSAIGAVYVFKRAGMTWTQQAYLKASNAGMGQFGWGIALSGDGNTLAAGAPLERGSATGVNGDQTNTSMDQAGAVYLY